MSLHAFDLARTRHQAPSEESEQALTVKYPLLYQVSKDGRTHYVLGHAHPMPLEAMPGYVRDTIAKCSVLLSESIVDIPEAAKAKLFHQEPTKNSFMPFLDDLIVQQLKTDLRPILASRGITEITLENISGTLLYQLFNMSIQRRMVKALPVIDETLIALFKQNHQPIFELNKTVDIDLFWKFCTETDAEICSNMSIDPDDEDSCYLIERAQSKLADMAREIKEHYQTGSLRIEALQKIEREFMGEDLDTELHKKQMAKELKEQSLFIETTCTQENKAWVTLFKELHQQGTDGMLLASGYMHTLASDESLLNLLANEGFTISRVKAPEVTFENQFARLSIK